MSSNVRLVREQRLGFFIAVQLEHDELVFAALQEGRGQVGGPLRADGPIPAENSPVHEDHALFKAVQPHEGVLRRAVDAEDAAQQLRPAVEGPGRAEAHGAEVVKRQRQRLPVIQECLTQPDRAVDALPVEHVRAVVCAAHILHQHAKIHALFRHGQRHGVLIAGDEDDLYPGEIKDIVLSILDKELKDGVAKNSRRKHILKDLLANNDYQGISKKKAEDLARTLNNYNGMTKKTRSGLEDFGFQIEEDGKHYRLIYHGDSRYNTTLAKTPSDTRGSKNMVHEIQKSML